MSSLKGKVAIITGAGRKQGLGQGIARRLAQSGCDVVISDIGQAAEHMPENKVGTTREITSIADAISRDTGVNAIPVACDVRDEDQVAQMMAITRDQLGRIDMLINNAGIGYVLKPLVDVSRSEWQAVLDVNLMGSFLTTKHAAKVMIEQGDGGRVVNIASQGAKTGFPHLAAYIASKHGMIGLTRTSALELGAHNITVNAVCPNHVTTGLGAEQNEYFAKFRGKTVEEYRADIRARNPLGRVGLVSDTANAVAFLCSDEACYINGDAINVSGGEEMH
ncbi:MAG: SDR family NAD(P)-dependent oxidoreductase [Gammaproteobacteria bacterium]